MKCRGSQTRTELVSKYQLTPLAHVKLLNGQQKKSCTGDLLTDSYYCFTYKNKQNNNEGSLFCGTHAANHFLELLNHKPLPMFNPLTSVSTQSSQGTNTSQNIKWHPATKELFNAINLLIICWNTTVKGFLGNIKNKLEKNPTKPPTLPNIKAVNTILSYDFKNRTLQQMLSDLRKVEPQLRSFTFRHINETLNTAEVQSHFG